MGLGNSFQDKDKCLVIINICTLKKYINDFVKNNL